MRTSKQQSKVSKIIGFYFNFHDFDYYRKYLLVFAHVPIHIVAACIDRKIDPFRFRAFFEKSR